METLVKLAGTDFDFSEGEERLEVLGKLRNLAQFLPNATSAELILIGHLETKDAIRVRLKIIYKEP